MGLYAYLITLRPPSQDVSCDNHHQGKGIECAMVTSLERCSPHGRYDLVMEMQCRVKIWPVSGICVQESEQSGCREHVRHRRSSRRAMVRQTNEDTRGILNAGDKCMCAPQSACV